jgi:RimJ/RimL family protein N-acetyltransferase
VTARVVLDNGEIVGAINCFQRDGRDYIGYWIDRRHWGRGVGSRALALFLQELKTRPLYASAATWNAASLRILEGNGFRRTGTRTEPETERYLAGEVADFVLE